MEHGEVGHSRPRLEPEPVTKRQWSPGFFEMLHALAPKINMEVPERLPSNPYRDKVLDELAED